MDVSDSPEFDDWISGVRWQSRECVTRCVEPSRWDSPAHVGGGTRYSLDIEAFLFSRERGNQLAIRASLGHGFFRLSGGA
jgi:hypothetical protein